MGDFKNKLRLSLLLLTLSVVPAVGALAQEPVAAHPALAAVTVGPLAMADPADAPPDFNRPDEVAPLDPGEGFQILPPKAREWISARPWFVSLLTLVALPILWGVASWLRRKNDDKSGKIATVLKWLGWLIEWVLPGSGRGRMPLAPPDPVKPEPTPLPD